MYTKNVGKTERVSRFIIGIILLIVGYKVSGVYGFLAYIFGVLIIFTGLLGWCWLYSLIGFSSKGKGFDKIPKSEVDKVISENRISPAISVSKEENTQKNIVEVSPIKSKTIIKTSNVSETQMATKKPVKKAVAKKAPVKKAAAPAKKAVVKKAAAPAKKAPAKKAVVKKSPVKKAAAPAKKAPAKKAVAKKAPVKKAAAPAKKAPAKKAPAKK